MSAQRFRWVWLLGSSLLLHGMLLRVPFSLESVANSPELTQVANPDEGRLSEDSEIAVATLPTVHTPVTPWPTPAPPPSQAIPAQLAPQPAPTLIPPVSDIPDPAPTPEPTSEPSPAPTPEPTPEPAALEAGIVVPFDNDFPHPVGSIAGCFALENCRRLENVGSHRQAAKDLVASLEAQGYQITPRDDFDDTGFELYEIVKPDDADGTMQYLSIFSDGIGSAVYTITQEIISLEELRQLG